MGRLFVILAALCGSLTPILSSLLGNLGWNALPISGIRGIFGATILAVILRRKIWSVRKGLVPMLLLAPSFAGGSVMYFYAFQHAPPGLVITLVYLGPAWVAGYDRWRGHGDRFSIPKVLLGLVGAVFIASGMNWHVNAEVLGIAVAFVLSFDFAFFTIAARRTVAVGVDSSVIAFWGLLLMAIAYAWWLPSVPWSWPAFGWSAVVGGVGGILYLWFLGKGFQKCHSDTEAASLQYIELVFVWIWSLLFFHEKPRWMGIVGAGCVLISGVLTFISSRRPSTVSST